MCLGTQFSQNFINKKIGEQLFAASPDMLTMKEEKGGNVVSVIMRQLYIFTDFLEFKSLHEIQKLLAPC